MQTKQSLQTFLLLALLLSGSSTSAKASSQAFFSPSQPLDLSTRWSLASAKPTLVILALHGMTMYGNTFAPFGQQMASKNVIVVAPDLPGYGRNRLFDKAIFSAPASLQFIDRAIDQLKAEFPGTPILIAGESLGAALAIQYVAKNPNKLDGLILSAPSFAFSNTLIMRLFPKLVVSAINPAAKIRLNTLMSEYMSADKLDAESSLIDPYCRKTTNLKELIRLGRALSRARSSIKKLNPRLPILVLQGSEDKLVNSAGIDFIKSHSTSEDKTLDLIQGAGHLLLEAKNPRKDVVTVVLNWLNKEKFLPGENSI